MPFAFLPLAAALFAAAPLEAGTVLEYEGTVVAEKGEESASRKDFGLTLLVETGDADSLSLIWIVREKNRGAWPWPDRFGRAKWNGSEPAEDAAGPALLYDRNEKGRSAVPLAIPLFAPPERWKKGAEFRRGRLTYEVQEPVTIDGRDGWRLIGSNLYGVQRRLDVDAERPIVLKESVSFFLGQGERHEISMRLAGDSRLDASRLDRARAAADSLLALRESLEYSRRSPETAWSTEQLDAIKAALVEIAPLANDTPLAAIADAAGRDVTDQKGRTEALAALKKRALGVPLDKIKLESISGGEFTADDLKGKVTVLHLWEYRDSPLEEPYGQVGYLDFLANRQADKDVAVYGVNVDERLLDGGKRASISSAKKVKSFMNLSYDILLDDGSLLARLGDPRKAGAALPLFVVIDRSGKLVHFHPGFYEVDRDRGLKELEDAVIEALAEPDSLNP